VFTVVDISTVSIVIASAGVFAAAIYYIVQIRHQTKLRQTDLIIRLYSFVASKEFCEAWEKFDDREITDLGTYKKKYGFVEFNQVVTVFDEIGVLLHKKLVEISVIDAIFHEHVIVTWEKMKPIIGEVRRVYGTHQLAEFEYLYNEMKKREQQQ